MLRAAYLSADGWRDIVDDTDVGNLCSQFDVFVIRLKAKYLAVTLTHALSHYEHTVNFLDICTAAIRKIDDIDFDGSDEDDSSVIRIRSPQTVMKWLREFRCNNCFPNPALFRNCNKDVKLPPIFHNNPDLYSSFLTYAKSNLSTLSGEMLHEYLHTVGTLCPRTVYIWLKQLGFVYSASAKSYYVDSHEKPENVQYRSKFIQRYKTYELRAHRWIQIPLSRYQQMVQDCQLSDTMGYKYTNEHGDVYVELHVDEHPLFQDESNHLPFGGSLSIRKKKEEKPVMILGQDECIFKQYSLNKKSWSDPNGTKALLPKDEGQGVMISAFTCRELGFGMELSPNQLHIVAIHSSP
jgi:hypothetical protein